MKNTLGKSITQTFYSNPDGYNLITNLWKQKISEGYQPASYELIAYAILRGKNYTKGFTPITNHVKLENGMYPHGGFRMAMSKFNRVGVPEYFKVYLVENINSLIVCLIPQESSGKWYCDYPENAPYKELCTFTV